jgi:polyhydroxybutyrate depolymerase
MTSRRWVLGWLLLAGCGERLVTPMGPADDGGADAGLFDAGPLPDPGSLVDGGADAGEADAGTADAGPQPDAGAALRCTGKPGLGGDSNRMIMSGGRMRRVEWRVPPAWDGGVALPLVLVFHGVTAMPAEIRQQTRFDELAEDAGFIAAFPAGVGDSWNAGICCGLARLQNVDDVQYVRDLLAVLEREYCVDPTRVFAAGFSNGGFFTHRLGCELSDRIAAIGVGSGQVGVPCAPGRAVPVIAAHGTNDPIVPFGGNPALQFPSTMTTMSGWAARNGCSVGALRLSEDAGVRAETWPGCRDGAEVTLYTVQGGAHDWFGGGTLWTQPTPLNNTLVFWDFFTKHPKR